MNRNLVLALGLLVALAVVVAATLNGGGGGMPVHGTAPAAAPQELAPPAASTPEALPDRDQAAAADAPRVHEGRTEVTTTAPENSFELQVLLPAGSPADGAEVWCVPSAGSEDRETFRDSASTEFFMRQNGTHHIADAQGKLFLPKPDGGRTLVLARLGDLYGTLEANEYEDELVLTLQEDVELEVQVVDVAGRPAIGVTVLIREKNFLLTSTVAQADTVAPDGVADFRHFQEEIRALFVENPEDEEESIVLVVLEALTREEVSVVLDSQAVEAGRVVLTLPATGSVKARVLGEDLEPFEGKARGSLELIPEGEPREVSPFSGVIRPKIKRSVENGEVVFHHVELGCEVGFEVRRDNADQGTRVYGDGPLRPGQTALLELQLGADHPVVRFRALDAAGGPLPNVQLKGDVRLRTSFFNNSSDHRLRTDSEGYFVVDLAQDWSEGSTRTLHVTLQQGDEPRPTASVDLSRNLDMGLNDLGDLVLEPPPVFVSGRVETESGKVLPQAVLEMRSRLDDSTIWNDHGDFQHKSEEDGTFEIRGDFTGASFQLAAAIDGYASRWVEFERGRTNLVLVLSAEGSIEGSVLLDEGIPPELLNVRVQELRGEQEHLDWDTRQQSLDADLKFRFGRLLPGLRLVTIRAESQYTELIRIEDVEVVSGEVCRDPRLQQVDLRGRLFYHEIELVGEEPEERLRGDVLFGPAGAEEIDERLWLSGKMVKIISQAPEVDVIIQASGYRQEELWGFRGKAEVRLSKGLAVTLVLIGDVELPRPPVFIKPFLVPVEADGGAIDFSGNSLDERRVVTAKVTQPGPAKLRWIIERRSPTSSVATSHELEREQRFDVLDIDGTQQFEVELTQEEMDELVEKLP